RAGGARRRRAAATGLGAIRLREAFQRKCPARGIEIAARRMLVAEVEADVRYAGVIVRDRHDLGYLHHVAGMLAAEPGAGASRGDRCGMASKHTAKCETTTHG